MLIKTKEQKREDIHSGFEKLDFENEYEAFIIPLPLCVKGCLLCIEKKTNNQV